MKINGVEYAGQREHALTFTLDVGTARGDAVAMTAAGTCGRGADGNPFYGRCISTEADGKGAVSGVGVVVVPWVGSAVSGLQSLVVNGAGAAKVGANGRSAFVIGVASGFAAIDLG